jgi:hypothetical protein
MAISHAFGGNNNLFLDLIVAVISNLESTNVSLFQGCITGTLSRRFEADTLLQRKQRGLTGRRSRERSEAAAVTNRRHLDFDGGSTAVWFSRVL